MTSNSDSVSFASPAWNSPKSDEDLHAGLTSATSREPAPAATYSPVCDIVRTGFGHGGRGVAVKDSDTADKRVTLWSILSSWPSGEQNRKVNTMWKKRWLYRRTLQASETEWDRSAVTTS